MEVGGEEILGELGYFLGNEDDRLLCRWVCFFLSRGERNDENRGYSCGMYFEIYILGVLKLFLSFRIIMFDYCNNWWLFLFVFYNVVIVCIVFSLGLLKIFNV